MIPILSIDAWRDGHGWMWNSWHKIGECGPAVCALNARAVLAFLRCEGYLTDESKGRVEIDDDGYNLVVCDRNDHRPLIALAYGEEED